MHEMSIHFCVNLKIFCWPFPCHLMSAHLPWKCHFTDSSQIVNLKTYPSPGKIPIDSCVWVVEEEEESSRPCEECEVPRELLLYTDQLMPPIEIGFETFRRTFGKYRVGYSSSRVE